MEEKGWAPPIEVFEKEDKFVMKAELLSCFPAF